MKKVAIKVQKGIARTDRSGKEVIYFEDVAILTIPAVILFALANVLEANGTITKEHPLYMLQSEKDNILFTENDKKAFDAKQSIKNKILKSAFKGLKKFFEKYEYYNLIFCYEIN